MVVHVLFPDSIQEPVGGLGEQFGHIYRRLNSKINFQVMGYPEKVEQPNYCGVYNAFPQLQHGSLSTIANQIGYFYASANCKVKPDLIHAYDWSSYVAGVYASQLHQVPLLCSMQLSVIGLRESGITYCADPNSADGNWIHTTHEMSEMLGLTYANKILQVSHAYSKRFPQFEDKTIVIENGIDYGFWKTKSSFEYPFGGKNKRKIVYIGRFATMKGIMQLCEAQIPEDLDLYFVGDSRGGEGYCFQAVQNKCNGVNIFHLGYLRGEAKKSLLQTADAVIMPSLHEPFGIVGLEALASKTILISSFSDGISDYLSPEVGIDCGKTKESIENALEIFRNMSDEELEERKEKGYQKASEYDWDKISEKYLNLYQSFGTDNKSKSLYL
jgi:glycosyltransferase involved in cell wall biosynthesis